MVKQTDSKGHGTSEADRRQKFETLLSRDVLSHEPRPGYHVALHDNSEEDKKTKDSFALYLLGKLHEAEAAGNLEAVRELAGQLQNMGPKVLAEHGPSQEKINEEVAKVEQQNQAAAISEGTRAVVNTVVYTGMDAESKRFFDELGGKHNVEMLKLRDGKVKLNDDGSVCKHTADGKELQDAFADLEYGKQDGKGGGILDKIKGALNLQDKNLSEDERLKAMIPSLQKMEEFKANQILEAGRGKVPPETMEEIGQEIEANHKEFEAAKAQVLRVISSRASVNAGHADPAIKAAGEGHLEHEKLAMSEKLTKVIQLLAGDKSSMMALSGGKSPDILSGMLANITGALKAPSSGNSI